MRERLIDAAGRTRLLRQPGLRLVNGVSYPLPIGVRLDSLDGFEAYVEVPHWCLDLICDDGILILYGGKTRRGEGRDPSQGRLKAPAGPGTIVATRPARGSDSQACNVEF